MSIFSRLTSYLAHQTRTIDQSIEKFVNKFSIDLVNNAGVLKITKAMFFNLPAITYSIIKISILLVFKPKQAVILLLSLSPAAARKIPQKQNDDKIDYDVDSTHHFGIDPWTMKTSEQIEKAGHAGVDTGDLQKLINEKFSHDAAITSKEQIANCNQIKKALLDAPRVFPTVEKLIPTIFAQKDFKMLCMPNRIQGECAGRFFHGTKTLYFAQNTEVEVYNSTFQHEFSHANVFFRHNTKCKTIDADSSYAPVHPVTEENVNKFIKALDAGDKRIRYFEELMNKKNQSIKLSFSETKLLKKYIKASETCLLDAFVILSTPELQQAFENRNKQLAQGIEAPPIVFNITNLRICEIKKLMIINNKTCALAQPIDAYNLITAIPGYVKVMLNNPIYKTGSSVKKFAEREAYTLERLSEEAYKVFYKEAYALKQEFFAACPLENEGLGPTP